MLDTTDENFDAPAPVPLEDFTGLDAGALRHRVRDFIATNGLSVTGVALVAGIAASTFSAWLGNTGDRPA
ncbi:hypothetical protein [Acidocella sp.]|uniref:hypothetical protein n=1 Tax=Acidocella sp. TaxID=50710 RepID=UPI002633A33F|nr:hypothetical protein [Acidocella sp.]